MSTAWRCTVCSYIHEDDGPPDSCPLCGADRARFVRKNGNPAVFLKDIYNSLVFHAAAAHFPNGMVPAIQIFLILAVFTGDRCCEHAVFYLLLFALGVIPVSFASGFRDWRKKYRGVRVPIFYKKMVLAGVLFILGTTAAIIRFTHPDILTRAGTMTRIYQLCLFAMLPMVVLLGHFGGKLAYQWKKVKR
jgi:uncharacterized membrane protein